MTERYPARRRGGAARRDRDLALAAQVGAGDRARMPQDVPRRALGHDLAGFSFFRIVASFVRLVRFRRDGPGVILAGLFPNAAGRRS